MRTRNGRRRVALGAAGAVAVSAALLGLADPAGAPPARPAAASGASVSGAAVSGAAGSGAAVSGPAVAGAALADPGPGALLAGPDPGAAPAGPPAPVVLARSEPVRIAVAALGLDTGLMPLGLRPDRTMEVPPDARSVGWFTGAPTPGERGPAVIAAHVDWAGRSGAFAELDSLAPGDEIRVGRADGATLVFVVERVGQYPKDRFPTAEVYGDLDHAGLRLITCGGTFDRGAQSYTDNVVVFASLRA